MQQPYRYAFIILMMVALQFVTSGCLTIHQDLTQKECRKYMVYPPRHIDELVSDRIARKWLRAMKNTSMKCDSIIDYESGKAFFMLLDIDNAQLMKAALAENSKRGRLFRRFGATHVIELTPEKVGSTDIIAAQAYALSPFVKDNPRQLITRLDLTQKEGGVIHRQHPWSKIFKNLNLLPNSVASGYSSSAIDNALVGKNQVYQYSEKDRTVLPPVISSLWIGNIRHRYSAGMWDVSADWFGSVITRYNDSRIELTPVSDPNTFDPDKVPPENRVIYNMIAMVVVPVIGGELAFYSPLGTTFTSISVGTGLAYTSDNISKDQVKIVNAVGIDVGHRIFFNDSIFIHFMVTAVSFVPDIVKNQYFAYDSRTTSIVGIGYYFPQVKTLARRMI